MPGDPSGTIFILYLGGMAVWRLFELFVEMESNKRKGVTAAWRRAAEECGLTDVRWTSSPIGRQSDLEGRSGRLLVRLEVCGKGKAGTRVVIGAEHHGAHALTLRHEDLGTAVEKRLGAREVELGDPAFDDAVYVLGPHTLARAILDAKTRPMVRRLLEGRIGHGMAALKAAVAFEQGDLRAEITGCSVSELGELLPGALRELLEAARRLGRPDDIATRLAEAAGLERLSEVRLQDILTLAREYPEHAATSEALRASLTDKDEEIRLRSAMALGEEGREALLELASNHLVNDSFSARAITALREHLPLERAQKILRRALRERRLETAGAALEALGRGRNPAAVAAIARVLSVEKAGVAVAAARALGACGLPAAERPLIEALARDPDALRVAAAEALGRLGSADAVLPLKEVMARGHGQDVRRAARQAIAQIQSRLMGAVPGQLSLTETETDQAGQLSLADGEAGRLSLAQDKAGRMSLAKEPES